LGCPGGGLLFFLFLGGLFPSSFPFFRGGEEGGGGPFLLFRAFFSPPGEFSLSALPLASGRRMPPARALRPPQVTPPRVAGGAVRGRTPAPQQVAREVPRKPGRWRGGRRPAPRQLNGRSPAAVIAVCATRARPSPANQHRAETPRTAAESLQRHQDRVQRHHASTLEAPEVLAQPAEAVG